MKGAGPADCGRRCGRIESLPEAPYAYLLGLYLGDGCLSDNKRSVYRLRVTLDAKYPGIIAACARAIAAVMPSNKIGRTVREGCIEVHSDSKHWRCLFPQHGSGPKHRRPIVLESWQREVAIERYPYLFLRGLIESDGWRGTNHVPGGYAYSRYMFSNRSEDIRTLFETACDRMGIRTRRCGRWQVAVSRRDDVARLDVFVGPKR